MDFTHKGRQARLAKQHTHNIRKSFEPQVQAAVVKASIQLRNKVDLKKVEEALQHHGHDYVLKTSQVMQHLGWDNFGKHLIANSLQHILFDAYRKGALMGAEQLKAIKKKKKAIAKFEAIQKFEKIQKLWVVVSKDDDDDNEEEDTADIATALNLTNQATIDFLNNYLPDLITGLNETQQQAVLVAIQNGFTQGRPIQLIARDIRNVVGLTPNMVQYIQNFRQQLESGEINGQTAPWERRLSAVDQASASAEFYSDETNWDRIDSLVDKYQFSLINRRGQNIARTEVHNASMAGQQDIWDQAQAEGLIDPQTTNRHWLGTDDGREREEHIEVTDMNPDGVPLDEPFDTPVGPVMFPGQSGDPAFDINCRCTVYLTFTDVSGGSGDDGNSDDSDAVSSDEEDDGEEEDLAA